jgi:triosephosphate isomerase (TIM)
LEIFCANLRNLRIKMMRKKLIAGNWKMHKTLAPARELVGGIIGGLSRIENLAEVEVLICPPFQLLFPMAKAIAGTPIKLGAQNVHYEAQGAFTGEVSIPMLADTGCTHILIGHSERRQIFHETNALLARKVRAVVAGEMQVIYCLGETIAEREAGNTVSIIQSQLAEVLDRDVAAEHLIIAYEPVWAIGTGKTATPQQAQEVHAYIRSWLADVYGKESASRIRILYGGSVKPSNAVELLGQPDIDGALVGGACLAVDDFLAIISAAASIRRT